LRRSTPLVHAATLLLACGPAGSTGRVVVEARSPAAQGDQLEEAIAIETAAGEIAPILERDCRLPCTETVTFGTAEEAQTEIVLYLYRGNGRTTEGATSLGVFEISGYPLVSGIETEVPVTFRADRDAVSIAVDPGPDGAVSVRRVSENAPRASRR